MPEPLRADLDAARVQGVAFFAGPVLQVRIVDAAMLEEAVLDMLVDGHDRLDVFEVVEPRAVSDLVQGTDWNQIIIGGHDNGFQ